MPQQVSEPPWPMDDLFESLPEHILHHILSLLPLKEAARTTLVSRSLQRAWYSHPEFIFDLKDFLPVGWKFSFIPYCGYPNSLHGINDRFLCFVDSATSKLLEQRIALRRLKIWATLVETDRSPALFDKCIGAALENGVQELDLKIYIKNHDWSYSVPARVFSSGFIKTLTLIGERLIAPLASIRTLYLNSLQSLKLCGTPINDQMLQKLLRGCPVLENLSLHRCRSLTQIIISGLIKLRTLDLSHNHRGVNRVEIKAPGLETFEYSAYCLDEGVAGTILVLDRSPKLKHLKFMDYQMTHERFQELLSKFLLLESLIIEHSKRLNRIKISNPLLQEILIRDCTGLEDIEIDAPKLWSFRYKSWEGLLPFIRMKNSCFLSVCEAEIRCQSHTELVANWFIELKEFFTRSCTFRSLSLAVNSMQGDVQHTDDPLPSLPCDIDQLNLDIEVPPSRHAAILDGLLSACRPTTLRAKAGYSENSFLKLLCENLAKRDDDIRCCCSEHIKCWLHELKGVEIEGITRSNHKGPLNWCTLFDLLPTLTMSNSICFRLQW
ncbi:hypothetical protein CDL15_Pgr020191 [Punica granatum]|nr:hypothetical protein CDL15_Pgr020191 [Punica granatum]